MTSGFLGAQNETGTGLSDSEIAWLSGSIFGAGAEVSTQFLATLQPNSPLISDGK